MRTFLKAKVPAVPDYEDTQVKLCAADAELTMRLSGGLNRAETKIPAGIYKPTGEMITMRLSISYRTDFAANKIEICGSEAVPGLTASVSLHLAQKEIRAISYGQKEKMLSCQPQDAFMRDTLEAVCQGVRGAALDAGISVERKVALGAYKDKYFVLQNGHISHIFDPEYEDFDSCDTVPVNSRYYGVSTLAAGTRIANVIQSSGDRYPRLSLGGNTLNAGSCWIKFWSFCTTGGADDAQRPPCCYYQAGTAHAHVCNSPNGGRLTYGNHSLIVTVGQAVQRAVPHGVAGISDVYILPGCNASNNDWFGIFILQRNTDAVRLQDYY